MISPSRFTPSEEELKEVLNDPTEKKRCFLAAQRTTVIDSLLNTKLRIIDVVDIVHALCEGQGFPESREDIERDVLIAHELMMERSETGNEQPLSEKIRDWCCLQSGYFSSTNIYDCLQLSTRNEKKNVSIILRRLSEENPPLIERYGQKAGCYRRINKDIEVIDWMNAPTNDIPVKWTFGIEQLVKTYPGNIIVIAGTSNSGKTAFLLDFIRLNMKKHDIHYFNSEMGPAEMKLRLQNFEGVNINEWRFNPYERSGNFADVIKSDAINIIDFMEIHDEFWKVGQYIKDIHDKLKSGIAVIAIQKNSKADLGRGGALGTEKPRLYLAMEPGRLKIVKGKNWRTAENPNGMCIDFKLVMGWKFLVTKTWYQEGKS